MSNQIVLTCIECHSLLTKPLNYNYGFIGSHEAYKGTSPVPEGNALWHKNREWNAEKQSFVFKPTVWVNANDLLKGISWEGSDYDWERFCNCGVEIGYQSTHYVSAQFFKPNLNTTYFWPHKHNQKKSSTELKDKIQSDQKSKESFEDWLKESF